MKKILTMVLGFGCVLTAMACSVSVPSTKRNGTSTCPTNSRNSGSRSGIRRTDLQ